MSDTYNGWTNYETWVVNLWMDNDGFSDDCREMAARCVRDAAGGSCPDGAAIRALADELKEQHEEHMQTVCTVPGVFGDLLNGALSSVNWAEIARYYIDEVKEESNAA